MVSFSETFSSLPALKSRPNLKEPIVCADGFRMSVQASRTHYCSPREDEGPYTSFEVGFPSAQDERLIRYAEDKRRPKNTVYGWVPAEVIDEVIAAHGGLKEDEA